jgi:hypothetical protein
MLCDAGTRGVLSREKFWKLLDDHLSQNFVCLRSKCAYHCRPPLSFPFFLEVDLEIQSSLVLDKISSHQESTLMSAALLPLS